MHAVEKPNDSIDAFVNRGGEGNLITVMMMPDGKAWRFADISPDKARQFAERLLSAANAAERNAANVPKEAPR
ncbi:hypothetical protein [Mesorhizobium sp.]|uniref:hypothetical protein n=1 Tax=Mesorhizobium sp. TaxID=1871066 RepID=UPI0012086298|nr:hypothetical protein [Mesorhizobium sp.]TIN82220.1 MAG: hypothetical protein E5X97_31195 [Mesorhizobium sp.]